MEAAVEEHSGLGAFGPAYEVMFRNDSHFPGSVDRVLQERMVRVCAETADSIYARYTPTEVEYHRGTRPALEGRVREAAGGLDRAHDCVCGIARFCSRLGERASSKDEAMVLGGTEEEILRRGSEWCTDVARVAVALFQVAGYPSRRIFLADIEAAYSGHAIVEVYRDAVWGAVDPSTGVLYLQNGTPATTWDLMGDPAAVYSHGPAAYCQPELFRAAAVSNYFVWESSSYDYRVSGLNEYYRSILEMADKGWPGGLRWLHGEAEVGGG